jgi:hypothetical protein
MATNAVGHAGIHWSGPLRGITPRCFPSLRAKLLVDWNLGGANPAGKATSFGTMDVRFENVGIDTGSVVSKLLGPAFERLDKSTRSRAPDC